MGKGLLYLSRVGPAHNIGIGPVSTPVLGRSRTEVVEVLRQAVHSLLHSEPRLRLLGDGAEEAVVGYVLIFNHDLFTTHEVRIQDAALSRLL